MKAPSPTLTSNTIASAPAAIFFETMLDGDQLEAVDGRGHVAKAVEPLVGGHEVRPRADNRHAGVANLRDELLGRELDPEARDRLELVERPARVAEPAPAHLREGHAAGSDDRSDRDGRLVAHAARRVLVHDLAAERRAEVDRLAGLDHRLGEGVGLVAREPPEEDRHAERRQLVVRHLVARVAEHQLLQLGGGQLAAVALPLDQLCRTDHCFSATKIVERREQTSSPSNGGTVPDTVTSEST